MVSLGYIMYGLSLLACINTVDASYPVVAPSPFQTALNSPNCYGLTVDASYNGSTVWNICSFDMDHKVLAPGCAQRFQQILVQFLKYYKIDRNVDSIDMDSLALILKHHFPAIGFNAENMYDITTREDFEEWVLKHHPLPYYLFGYALVTAINDNTLFLVNVAIYLAVNCPMGK